MKIVFYLPALHMGGAERHTLDLCRRLLDRGVDASIIVQQSDVAEGLRAAADEPHVRILGLKGMSRLHEWPKVFSAFRSAAPDIVVAVNEAMAIRSAIIRALGRRKFKIVCVFHSTDLLQSDELRLPMFRWAVRRLDALVFVSRNQREHWGRRGLQAAMELAIVNGVDLDHFSGKGERAPAKLRLGLSPSTYVIGLLASFRAEKNHAQAVRALCRLRDRGIDASLVFVGDGELRGTTEGLVQELGLAGRVVFAGEHSDVRPMIAAFDVGLICSTEVETFSLAALEILASGAPMIMSNIGGASEIVQDGENGFLFPRGDDDALVDRLLDLADPVTRAKVQARARGSVEQYTIERMLAAYLKLFSRISPGQV